MNSPNTHLLLEEFLPTLTDNILFNSDVHHDDDARYFQPKVMKTKRKSGDWQ